MNKTVNSRSARIEWIDLAKGFCIILVVLYHVCNMMYMTYPLWVQTTAFRMPLYFILSGLFFKQYEGFIGFLKRKTNKLLIPFLFFMLITSVIPYAFMNHRFSLEVLFSLREVVYNLPIWFLLCLFEINIIFYLIQWAANSLFSRGQTLVVIFTSLALGVLGLYMGVSHIRLHLYLDTALSALPFFAFGWWLNRKTSFLRIPSRPVDILIIVACAAILGLFALPVSWIYNTFSIEAVWVVYLCGISGTIMILLVSKFIKHLPLVSFWGRYSIMILCTHFPIATAISAVLSRVLAGVPLLLATLVLTMCVCHFLIPVLKKYLPYFTAQKDLIKV